MSRRHLLSRRHIFLLGNRKIWLPNKTKSCGILLEFEWFLPLCSWIFDMFESSETMSATLKLYKLHPRCGRFITFMPDIPCKPLLWFGRQCVIMILCYVLAIFKRGVWTLKMKCLVDSQLNLAILQASVRHWCEQKPWHITLMMSKWTSYLILPLENV